MPVHEPFFSLLEAEVVPVVCPGCGYHENLRHPRKDLCQALYARTFLDEAREEVEMLERVERLFSRFPEAQGFINVSVDQILSGQWPLVKTADDPALQEALDADPELTRFLQGSSFSLPARLRFLREQVQHMEEECARGKVAQKRCPACHNNHLRVEHTFYNRLCQRRLENPQIAE